MMKMTPVKLSAETNQAVQKQLGVQEVQKAAPKSADPANFPVFEVPVNKKVLIYVPNHVVADANGADALRMDKPLIHSITDGKRFYSYRCISGIEAPEAGLTGECPLCDGCSEPWDLANLLINEKCKAANLDPEDTENPNVKRIRSESFSDRVLKDATRYFTFPIVVFETLNDDGKTFVKDGDQLKYKVMWYTISESQYEEKWKKTLDAMEDEPTHPGGNFFMLNYCYTPKSGEPNKRDSARNLAVNHRNVKGSEQLRAQLDELTAKWTPEKAQEMVIANQLYTTEQLQKVTDTVLEGTRNMIALYTGVQPAAGAIATSGNGEGFALEKKADVPTDNGEAAGVPLEDVDLDME